MDSSDSENAARPVQAAVTCVSFPKTLNKVRDMGKKWLKLIGKDWITDMDVLLDFPVGKDVGWIAPKWLMAGDILFFYHTESARNVISRLLEKAKQLRYSPTLRDSVPIKTQQDEMMMVRVMERAARNVESYSGTILGFAEVAGRPARIFDELKHFQGTIYAPLADVHTCNYPLAYEGFNDILIINKTTISVNGSVFNEIKRRLAIKNKLPAALKNTKPAGLGFREITADNWDQVACHKDTRFIDEEQICTYYADYVLSAIKDPGSAIYKECNCFRGRQRTGRVDYFIKLAGNLLPVEAKVNVLAEQDIASQIRKYIHIDYFVPAKDAHKDTRIGVDDSPFCLVIDQAGIYLTKDGEFFGCGPDLPLFERENLVQSKLPHVRDKIIKLLGEALRGASLLFRKTLSPLQKFEGEGYKKRS